jgi:adenylate cyclase class 2
MIEFEVKIPNVNIAEIQRRLCESGAVLQKPAVVHEHIMFCLPSGREIKGGWLRVRNEGDKVTMSLKVINGNKIVDQQEYCFVADSLEDAVRFLELMGAIEKARSEKRRETWVLGNCEVVIDEWPFLEPIIEIEGSSEEMVMETVGKLGFLPVDCRVCGIDKLYEEKYGIAEDIINNHTPLIIFDMDNPFLK